MPFPASPASSPPAADRSGATLTEVLMAVMLMGIGVVTLATLFPISILRSIQATQLTNATILRYNAEATLGEFPDLVMDPDFILTTNETVDDPLNAPATPWLDNVYVVDPLGWNLVEPLSTDPTPGIDLTYAALPEVPGTNPQDFFGNNGTGHVKVTRRYGWLLAAFLTELAREITTLPDSWIVQVDAVPTAFTQTSVTLPSSVDLTTIPVYEDVNFNGALDVGEDVNGNGILDSVASRIHLFDSTGRAGQTRNIVDIDPATNSVRWDEFDQDISGTFDQFFPEDRNANGFQDTNALPANFSPERVRILIKDQRYTWMMTVRNNSGVAAINVVVFFKRSFDAASERVYGAAAGNAFNQGSTVVGIDYVGIPKPFLKKGSYVFDAGNGYWYRIQDIVDNEAAQHIDLTIGRTAVASGNSAILLKGVVEVFPIGSLDP